MLKDDFKAMTSTESLFDSLPHTDATNSRFSQLVDLNPGPNEHVLPPQPSASSSPYRNDHNYLHNNESNVIWIKNCSSPFDNVDFEDARILGSLIPLGLICLMVIFGNIMVITAVKITHKLRGATNLFIVSLAWADLMLGIIVLPFSAMYEVFKMWLFGKVW